MPILTPDKLSRLTKVGFDKMNHFRKARVRFLAQYVSRFYGQASTSALDQEDKKASPINLLYNAVTTYVPNLAYNDPKAKIRTNYLQYRPYADMLELAVNEMAQRSNLRETLRMAITDSIFSAGWIKTGLCDSGKSLNYLSDNIPVGELYICRVDPDDMVVDPMARHWEEMIFIGNRFRVPRQSLLDSGYDNDAVKKLPGSFENYQRQSAQTISNTYMGMDEANTITDYVDLVECYLPQAQQIVTFPYDRTGSSDKYLRVVDYDGPDSGPYHMLGYAFVPDNIMPVAPAMVLMDLHMMANRAARKIAKQAERAKTILAYEGAAVEDAQEIVDSDDGETVKVDQIDAIKEVKFGGASEDGYKYLDWVRQRFSELANNMDQLSGNKSSAPTATQSEMLQANSSIRLQDMQNLCYQYVAKILRDVAFYLHTDPLIELPLIHRKAGVETQVVYTPEMRRGEWMDYMVDVQPYSMARQDPNMKVRRVLDFASTVIPAAAQALASIGPAFNIQGFLAMVAKEVGIEEADEIINDQVLQQMLQTQLAGMQMAGINTPQKPAGFMANYQNAQMAAAQAQGPMQPNQPNPGQMGPNGGVSPQMESNQQAQDAPAEMQANMKRGGVRHNVPQLSRV